MTAAARMDLLTSVDEKLSAAIAAALPSTRGPSEVEP
jgi:hypothetical protein